MPGFNNAISKLILSMKKARLKDFQIIQIEIFIWVTNFNKGGQKSRKEKQNYYIKYFFKI